MDVFPDTLTLFPDNAACGWVSRYGVNISTLFAGIAAVDVFLACVKPLNFLCFPGFS